MTKQPWLVDVEDALLDVLEFADTREHQELLAGLLSRTQSLTDRCFGEAIAYLANQVESVWSLDPTRTWFVSSNSKENTDSSQEVLNRLKSFRWHTPRDRKRFLTRYRDVDAKLAAGFNVVIVDDFVGTGRSIGKTIDWFENIRKTKSFDFSIWACVVAGCGSGLDSLASRNIGLASAHRVSKGISDHFTGDALARACDDMTEIERKLASLASDSAIAEYSFGYGRSEAMYYRAGGNTPNNVFPVFWWRRLKRGTRRTVMHRT